MMWSAKGISFLYCPTESLIEVQHCQDVSSDVDEFLGFAVNVVPIIVHFFEEIFTCK